MNHSASSSSQNLKRDIDWYAMACKIRTQNEKLKQEMASLKKLISEQKEQIKVQVIKNQDSAQAIIRQEELNSSLETQMNQYQEQVEQQEQQIDIQQSTINQLTQELEKIQQQAARLERECSLLQDNYQQEHNKLQQMEVENKDLRIRLQRQQRYNLQYKTALDQFLDTSTVKNANSDSNGLGIKSWSDSDSDSDEIKDAWQLSPINSEGEIDEEDDSFTLGESEEEPDLTPENQTTADEAKETETQTGSEKKNRNKLFIKLPQFGLKKKNEE